METVDILLCHAQPPHAQIGSKTVAKYQPQQQLHAALKSN